MIVMFHRPLFPKVFEVSSINLFLLSFQLYLLSSVLGFYRAVAYIPLTVLAVPASVLTVGNEFAIVDSLKASLTSSS